jgi:peptide/nickel transport system substrate-binding protein
MTTRRNFIMSAAAIGLARPALAQNTRQATLRFVPQSSLAALDPIWTSASVTTNHGYCVFDTLYAVDHANQPKPQMAEGHEVSADGRVWRIRLREGLTFHDGTPVRSVDCVASLRRWAQVDPLGQLMAKRLDDFATPEDRVLEIRLQRPFPLTIQALAKPDAVAPFIMPERLAKTPASVGVTEMVGSGPYRFLPGEFNPGSRAVYEKFTGYVPRQEAPDWATGAKIAHFDRLEWIMIPDASTAASALRAGEVDWWERPTPDLLPLLKTDHRVTLQSLNKLGQTGVIRLNCLQPPFNNVAVRRAMLMSVVQEDYMRAVNGDDNDAWTTCYSLYPRGTPYYSEDGAALLKGPHDSATVHAALQAGGYAGEKVVILNPTDFPTIGPFGEVAFDALKRAGMNVDLAESDWGTVVQGGWSLFSTYATVTGVINPAVSPLLRGQGLNGWFGWWEDAEIEHMIAEWIDAPDEATQMKLAHAIDARALDQVATVPVGQGAIRTAFRSELRDVLQANNPLPWSVRRT